MNELDNFRQLGDEIADRLVTELYKGNLDLRKAINELVDNESMFHYAGKHSDPLADLISSTKFPDFIDPAKLKTAKKFFERYAYDIIGILGVYSLPYCYAAANGSRVLIHSKKLVESPQKRLSETAQFLVDIFEKESFEPKGRGYLSIMKVRIMHATARYFAARHIKEEVPVNQEDMAGTNLAFSIICLRGLQKTGIELDKKTREAYVHFWNVIGFMLGIERALLPQSLNAASVLERSIRKRQFRFSKEGETLTRALIKQLELQMPKNLPVKAEDIVAHFLGARTASQVGLVMKGRTSVPFLFSAIKLSNALRDYSSMNYDKTIRMVTQQVEASNGDYFTI